jgi:hypothetical protein
MYNKYKGRGFHPLKIVFFLLVAAVFIAALGWVVMFLWNHTLAEVTSVQPLSYFQAIGLLLLARILFGSFRFGPPPFRGSSRSKRAYWKEKWMNMSEEEKAAFKERWKKRC